MKRIVVAAFLALALACSATASADGPTRMRLDYSDHQNWYIYCDTATGNLIYVWWSSYKGGPTVVEGGCR